MTDENNNIYDLLIIGGGINGVGIARDAAGRGLKVALCERGDLGGATSSASSKFIHGGLRYLEYYKFRLVKEALAEREVILKIAPHIVWPLTFIMPHVASLRPVWMIRLGLFLYDRLGGKRSLPGSSQIDLRASDYGASLKDTFKRGFAYADCWVDDARLVIFNAMDAAKRGADILPRTSFLDAHWDNDHWNLRLKQRDGEKVVQARALVNAAGPWVKRILDQIEGVSSNRNIRWVKGSHIVVPRLYEGQHAFILQNDDGRVVFLTPYESHYTVIGTTDVPVDEDPEKSRCSEEEQIYLCKAANKYLATTVSPDNIVWTYAGVRPLYDDGSDNPSEVSRDYLLELAEGNGTGPVLTVFGGKLTTYRRLSEQVLEKLQRLFPTMGRPWTAKEPLPGGDFTDGKDALAARLREEYPNLPADYCTSLAKRHGSCASTVLGNAKSVEDLGDHFGHDLYAREVEYFKKHEWAQTADDVLWRRTKVGLHLSPYHREAVAAFLLSRRET